MAMSIRTPDHSSGWRRCCIPHRDGATNLRQHLTGSESRFVGGKEEASRMPNPHPDCPSERKRRVSASGSRKCHAGRYGRRRPLRGQQAGRNGIAPDTHGSVLAGMARVSAFTPLFEALYAIRATERISEPLRTTAARRGSTRPCTRPKGSSSSAPFLANFSATSRPTSAR